ncbi:unnamed protein product [Cylindrotheca closterium]|uniref:Protein kinase domain-containing protein n=1 Tax=Cylindrotheca closterium TaxID=2856 RepID=A0AAD2FRN3_9STRA|nr:unnamed protein product [Cylindrotheca closterium]
MSKGFSSELTVGDSSDGEVDESLIINDEVANNTNNTQSGKLSVPPTDHVRRKRRGAMAAEKAAESIYEGHLSSASWVAETSKVKDIPKFDTSELKTGSELGSGCFGSVWEVKGFDLHGESNNNNSEGANPILRWPKLKKEDPKKDVEVDSDEIESRNFIAKHCYRKNGDARYALKKLKPGTVEDELGFINGMNDLANETLFLSSLLNHPNVIKLRGIAMASMFSEDYFVVLDRLYDTLHTRILKWKKKRKRANGLNAGPMFRDRRRAVKEQMLEEKMKYAMDLVAAIAYIHEHRIMHRDLKPDNIGFDVRNDIKVFDFGLARELPPPKTNSPDESFHFTAAGSPRYMAPEIGNGEPYNQACDIYSFALVFWEMLHMSRPYPKQTKVVLLQENVWSPSGRQMRPAVSPKTAPNVQKILHQSWHVDPATRPKAPQLLNSLKQECLKIRASMRVSHAARRSTFVFGHEEEDDSSNRDYTGKSSNGYYDESEYNNIAEEDEEDYDESENTN